MTHTRTVFCGTLLLTLLGVQRGALGAESLEERVNTQGAAPG